MNAPRWIQALSRDNGIVKELVDILKNVGSEMFRMRDVDKIKAAFADSQYFEIGDGASVDAGAGASNSTLKSSPNFSSRFCRTSADTKFPMISRL